MFDLKGSVAALVVGLAVSFLGSIRWLILLLIFAVFSHLATKAYFDLKQKNKLQEGEKGERKMSNVFYAGITGLVIALLNVTTIIGRYPYFHYFELFAISLSVISADTFASEIGIVDRKVYMITNLKRTVPGINGGVSVIGQLAALLGASIVGVSYGLLSVGGFNILQVFIVILLGFIGCQIDSYLGALFENKGKLSKGEVNFIASFSGVILGALFLYLL
ncbi:MAG: DUF92 domain-containing protein [Candidatus Thermoplasmatota archaeon]|nr:DUF92 domain-containing protein [Candidatus Thermoplasmatota archaeon]MCL5881357.1 DUF92 domain-containing protein [Candidatus Thermoplasmatota archaeon]